MNLAKKILIGALCAALIMSATVVGTLAYLTDTSEKVVNTFTVGNVSIKLDETQVDVDGNLVDEDGSLIPEGSDPFRDEKGNSYKMIPGREYLKDPMVFVDEESENCWLFVKLEKSENYDNFLEQYEVANGWDPLFDEEGKPVEGVYYRKYVKADAESNYFYVLAGKAHDDGSVTNPNGSITVKTSVTSDMVKDLTPETYPTLTITAYAVQHEGIDSEVAAWAIIEEENKPTEEPPVETPTNPAP